MYTPWGKAQSIYKITRGVVEVSTASHGGIGIAIGYAEKHYPKEVLNKAIFKYERYWFEEDCAYALPLYYNYDLLMDRIFYYKDDGVEEDFIEDYIQYIKETVMVWYPSLIKEEE